MGTSDSDSNRTKMSMNSRDFIPPSELRDVEYLVQDVSMKTIQDNTGKLVIVYSVKWKEEEKKSKKKEEEEPRETIVLEEMDTDRELEMMATQKEPRSKVHDGAKVGGVVCDGPCGKWRKMKDVVQFGCDHAICKLCRQTEKSTILFDGSPGCSNKRCVKEAEEIGEKLFVGRNLSSIPSDLSMRSNEGPWEVLAVHVVVMRKMVGQMFKTRLEYEFPSQSRIASLTKTLAEYKDIIRGGTSYFCLKKPKSRADLELISLKDTNLRFYHLPGYSFTSGKVYFLVVGRGILLK